MNLHQRIKLKNWLSAMILISMAVLLLAACSPYASVDVGVPFNIGPVHVNPSIGVGRFF
jgi:hypothetical protein